MTKRSEDLNVLVAALPGGTVQAQGEFAEDGSPMLVLTAPGARVHLRSGTVQGLREMLADPGLHSTVPNAEIAAWLFIAGQKLAAEGDMQDMRIAAGLQV